MFQNIATAQVVTSEKYKLNYKELKDRPMTFEEPLNYQTMAGDDIIQCGQEFVSTESDSISTNGLEQYGIICVETIYYSEQLKVSMSWLCHNYLVC